MAIKSDRWIIDQCNTSNPLIFPFEENQVREVFNGDLTPIKTISFGVSSYGYDFRIANEFLIFKNTYMSVIDPKNFDDVKSFDKIVVDRHQAVIIPPNSFALGRTVEYFRIPRNVLTVCLGKSTYARCGIIINVTPFEPEWEGYATIEISNTTPLPANIYANEGIGQLLFFESDEVCQVSYKDKKGKYDKQTGIVTPRI